MVFDIKCAVASFIIADKNQNREIRKKAFDLMCYWFEEIPASELNRLDFHLLQDILMNNINLHVKQDMVFNRLVEWFRHDETEREKYMVELLELIRLEFIPSPFLMGEQLEAIYKQFNCFGSILDERKSRETPAIEGSEDDQSRVRSIFCVCKHDRDQTIYFDKYNKAANVFEEASAIDVGDLTCYETQLHGNDVYVIGGEKSKEAMKSVSRFDFTSGKEEVLPEMHVARSKFSSILLGKYIYVFGGYTNEKMGELNESSESTECDYSSDSDGSDEPSEVIDSRIYTNSCERLDLETMTWTVLRSMNRARWASQVIALNGYIYVVAGINRRISKFALDLYDPKNDEWHQLAGIDQPGTKITLFTSNSFLFSCGDIGPLHRYDASRNVWTQVEWSSERLLSSVETVDGIFGIKMKGKGFGKVYLNADGIWSFELMIRAFTRFFSSAFETFLVLN